jgi:hypothetical protein
MGHVADCHAPVLHCRHRFRDGKSWRPFSRDRVVANFPLRHFHGAAGGRLAVIALADQSGSNLNAATPQLPVKTSTPSSVDWLAVWFTPAENAIGDSRNRSASHIS